MKKIVLFAILCTFLCTVVTYAYHGTYTAMDIAAIQSQGKDDEHFVMEGKFVEHVRKDYYVFEDNNGDKMTVEVDDHVINSLSLGESVRVYGDIDIDHGTVEVEIDRIERL